MATHCWHHADLQHLLRGHEDVACCQCGQEMCLTLEPEGGHGPYAPILYTRPAKIHMSGCTGRRSEILSKLRAAAKRVATTVRR